MLIASNKRLVLRMNIIMDKISFAFFNICIPLVLSIIYSKNPQKQQINYEITKGIWYLFYGGVVAVDYLYHEQTKGVAGFTVTLAIMEGVPLILKKVFNANED